MLDCGLVGKFLCGVGDTPCKTRDGLSPAAVDSYGLLTKPIWLSVSLGYRVAVFAETGEENICIDWRRFTSSGDLLVNSFR